MGRNRTNTRDDYGMGCTTLRIIIASELQLCSMLNLDLQTSYHQITNSA
jgi:hypothetical protein